MDAGLDEAGKAEASSLLLADAADRRNAGLPRLLCLFVDLKDSHSAAKHTLPHTHTYTHPELFGDCNSFPVSSNLGSTVEF